MMRVVTQRDDASCSEVNIRGEYRRKLLLAGTGRVTILLFKGDVHHCLLSALGSEILG